MVSRTIQSQPDVVCISALPPFALVNAKSVYNKLRAHAPRLKILIGLWNYPGNVERIAARLQLAEGSRMAITLSEVVDELASSKVAAPTVLSETRV
jgi:hypothetical protein